MAAGFLVDGQCLDASSAPSFMASRVPPVSVPGSTIYTSTMEVVSGALVSRTYQTTTSGTTLYASVDVSNILQSCDTTETFFDGLTLGWGVVLAMALAYAVHIMRRGL